MRYYFLFLLSLLLSGTASAQESSDTPPPPQVFTYVAWMPQSTVDISDYLSKNLVYPADAKAANKQGRVLVKFIVNEHGKIQDVRIVRSVFPSIDSEAVRLIKGMPDWKPGKQGGKPVSVYYTQPITFSLN